MRFLSFPRVVRGTGRPAAAVAGHFVDGHGQVAGDAPSERTRRLRLRRCRRRRPTEANRPRRRYHPSLHRRHPGDRYPRHMISLLFAQQSIIGMLPLLYQFYPIHPIQLHQTFIHRSSDQPNIIRVFSITRWFHRLFSVYSLSRLFIKIDLSKEL